MLHPVAFAGVAQLVEHELPKLEVAGSSPVARSTSVAPTHLAMAPFGAIFLPAYVPEAQMPKAIRLFAALLVAVGCGDVVRAPITVVVDTDRSRVVEEQGRLQALRIGVQGDRAELEHARSDLQQARRRLQDAATDPGRRAAAAEVAALEARVSAVVVGVSRADLDVALLLSEARVTASISAELERLLAARSPSPSASPSPSLSPAAPLPIIEDPRAVLTAARQALARRQLLVADIVGGQARLAAVDAALATADRAAAVVSARAFAADVAAVAVDRPLVRRRYERVSRAVNAAGQAKAFKQQLADATAAISSEDFAAANRLLAEVEAKLH